jgi:hypothetical protein
MSVETTAARTEESRKRPGALILGPRKKPYVTFKCGYTIISIISVTRSGTDPLVHHGRHFGRTVHALCSVQALVTNGLIHVDELAVRPEAIFTDEYV